MLLRLMEKLFRVCDVSKIYSGTYTEPDWSKTSLKPYVEHLSKHVLEVMQDNMRSKKNNTGQSHPLIWYLSDCCDDYRDDMVIFFYLYSYLEEPTTEVHKTRLHSANTPDLSHYIAMCTQGLRAHCTKLYLRLSRYIHGSECTP